MSTKQWFILCKLLWTIALLLTQKLPGGYAYIPMRIIQDDLTEILKDMKHELGE